MRRGRAAVAGEERDPLVEFGDEGAPGQRSAQMVALGQQTQFHLLHDDGGKALEYFHLFGRKGAGPGVDGAERPQIMAVGRAQLHPGIAADARLSGHQRIVAKARIGLRVSDDERFVLADGMVAKGHAARGFGYVEARDRLEPLAFGVDQRHG